MDIQASHFTWQSSNNATYVIPYAPDSFPVSLASHGDLPLNITSTVVAITFSSYYDNGKWHGNCGGSRQANNCLSGPVQLEGVAC